MDTIYDTTVVAYSNGDLRGRRPNNSLDQRLTALEAFLRGERRAMYNHKLRREYSEHVIEHRNDVIVAFLIALGDRGHFVKRNTLSRQGRARAQTIRWPKHDQHLLAAAIEGNEATIFVTEKALADCAGGAKREFRVNVVQL